MSDPASDTPPPGPTDELQQLLVQATVGEYVIERELGRGGMAAVFLAHEIALDRKVAIKILPPELTYGTGMIERFKREAKTAAQLNHPHIIPIYGVKQAGRTLYFVMKYVEGRSLESIIDEAGQLPIAMVHAILTQTGGALGYAHRRGVIHRDVKPANIMIDEEGWAVVTDFGIAKALHVQTLTATGAAIGTPYYMSPEQCTGKGVSSASDQYSLGIVAHQMLAGSVPFKGDSVAEIMKQHFMDQPPDLAVLRPDCPAQMIQTIQRTLAKDPAQRFPSVEDFIAALGTGTESEDQTVRSRMVELARSGSAPAMQRIATPLSPVPMARSPVVPPASLERRRVTLPESARAVLTRRPGSWAVLATTLVIAVAAGATWIALRSGRTPTRTAPTADTMGRGAVASESLPSQPAAPVESAAAPPADTAEAPETTPGTLVIRNMPAGAVARVDGRPVSPSGSRLDVGTHLLEITASGFQPYSERVRITAASQTIARPRLEPLPPPAPAAQPATAANAPPAPEPTPAVVPAPAPRETSAAVAATPPAPAAPGAAAPPVSPFEPGQLTVGARPLGSATLNGQPIARWPAVNLPMLPGTYVLVIRATGYADFDTVFVIRPGQRVNLRTIVLTRREGEPQ